MPGRVWHMGYLCPSPRVPPRADALPLCVEMPNVSIKRMRFLLLPRLPAGGRPRADPIPKPRRTQGSLRAAGGKAHGVPRRRSIGSLNRGRPALGSRPNPEPYPELRLISACRAASTSTPLNLGVVHGAFRGRRWDLVPNVSEGGDKAREIEASGCVLLACRSCKERTLLLGATGDWYGMGRTSFVCAGCGREMTLADRGVGEGAPEEDAAGLPPGPR